MRISTLKYFYLFLGIVGYSNGTASDNTSIAIPLIPRFVNITSQNSYNPILSIGGMPEISSRLGIVYSNRYMLKETNSILLFGCKSWKRISLGLSSDYFGISDYWMSSQQIIVSKKLSQTFNMGLSITNILSDNSTQKDIKDIIVPSIGLLIYPSNSWKLSCKLQNISHNSSRTEDFNTFQLSISHQINQLNFHLQFDKQYKNKQELHFFIDYICNQQLIFYFRASKSNEPIGCGIDFKGKKITYRLQFSYHSSLGLSSEFEISK